MFLFLLILILFQFILGSTQVQEQVLCALKLQYKDQDNYLLDKQANYSMPYILTSNSPHFALNIQEKYLPSKALNNSEYFLIRFPDAYVFGANISQIQWIEIQEFKLKKKQLVVDTLTQDSYFGYYVLNGNKGGHLVVSTSNLARQFKKGKTDSLDQYSKGDLIFIISWGGQQDYQLLFQRFINLIEDTNHQDYCSLTKIELTQRQIQCNLDLNFNEITFRIPDLYKPPIHYHIGNQLLNTTNNNNDDYLISNYPGLQVLVARNLTKQILELRFPIKNFETNQKVLDSPQDGLIITVKEGNHGFIHIVLFQDEEGLAFDYVEDQELGYVRLGYSSNLVYVFSYVTSSFSQYPKDDLIEHMFENCCEIIKQRNNICPPKREKQCELISKEYFHQQQFQLDIPQKERIKFTLNSEYLDTPYIEMIDKSLGTDIKFDIIEASDVSNIEMNHAGYVASLLRIQNIKNKSNINSLVINRQNENIEVTYTVLNNIYQQLIINNDDKSFVLVFQSEHEISDVIALQLFREFVDHLQRSIIMEKIQTGCYLDEIKFDVQPIQFNAVHKSIQFSPEFIQQSYDDNNNYSDDDNNSSDDDNNSSDDENNYSNDDNDNNNNNNNNNNDNLTNLQPIQNTQQQFHQVQTEKFKPESIQNQEDGQKGKIIYTYSKKESQHPVIKTKQQRNSKQKKNDDSIQEDGNKQQRLKDSTSDQNSPHRLYQMAPDYRYLPPHPPILVGQSVEVPKNPNDVQLGQFFREIINKLHVYADPCQADSPNYDKDQCQRNIEFIRQNQYRGYGGYPDRGYGGYQNRGYGGYPDRGYGGYPDRGYGGYPDRGYGGYPDRGYGGYPDRGYGYPPRDQQFNKQQDSYPGPSRDPYYQSGRNDFKACITVYSKCEYQGDSLQLCGHQKLIPKSQEAMEILSIRAEEYYVIEFYVQSRHGQSELYTLKGSQPCLKYPLRVDQFLQ